MRLLNAESGGGGGDSPEEKLRCLPAGGAKKRHIIRAMGEYQKQQGNSVARDLPPTGLEVNTTIFFIYILDIDSHCPYRSTIIILK